MRWDLEALATDELWYGLRALHCLNSSGNWELRIDFTFDNGTYSFIHYNYFRMGPATDNYQLSISGFTGITLTDPFTTINKQQFSTYDRDNDQWSSGNCAVYGHRSTAQVDDGIEAVFLSTSTTTMGT